MRFHFDFRDGESLDVELTPTEKTLLLLGNDVAMHAALRRVGVIGEDIAPSDVGEHLRTHRVPVVMQNTDAQTVNRAARRSARRKATR